MAGKRTRASGDVVDGGEIRDESAAVEPDDEYDEDDEGYDGNDEDDRSTRSRRRELSARDAARHSLRHLVEMTSRKPVGVTSVEPAEGGWIVGVELIEDHRVPSSADILALYEVEIDMAGTVLAYRRRKRYPRGSGDTGEGS